MRRRRWLDEAAYAELVAVANLLPGPTSSQVGIAVGSVRAGKAGGVAAWAGFTLPSAVVMLALGVALAGADVSDEGWLRGLQLVAAAVVATAVVSLARTLAPDAPRLAVAAGALALTLALPGAGWQALAIGLGALAGLALGRGRAGEVPPLDLRVPVGRRLAVAALVLFAALLVALPLLRGATGSHAVAVVDSYYRTGSLVFGGGHVVLPLLHDEVVEPGWVDEDTFLAGYGAAQALPGPLFAFAAYLGAAQEPEPNGVPGGLLALGAIFAPSFLLLAGLLPAWAAVRRHAGVRAAVWGTGAAVVGLLAAALWDPVLVHAVDGWEDALLVLAFLAALRLAPVWGVVAAGAAIGAVAL